MRLKSSKVNNLAAKLIPAVILSAAVSGTILTINYLVRAINNDGVDYNAFIANLEEHPCVLSKYTRSTTDDEGNTSTTTYRDEYCDRYNYQPGNKRPFPHKNDIQSYVPYDAEISHERRYIARVMFDTIAEPFLPWSDKIILPNYEAEYITGVGEPDFRNIEKGPAIVNWINGVPIEVRSNKFPNLPFKDGDEQDKLIRNRRVFRKQPNIKAPILD